MKAQTISIIGLQRLGASVGLALKKSSLGVAVVGHDPDRRSAQWAESAGAVDKIHRSLYKAAAAADILILAVPVSQLEEALAAIGEAVQEHTLVLDLSGWKTAGLEWAKTYLKQGHYVGAALILAAEALADGRDSVETASEALFQNSLLGLMPSVDLDPKAVETAVNLGAVLGAKPYFVDPMEYDSLVQGLETVPGLLAAAMFNSVSKTTGWRDMLRFAGLPFALSTQPLKGAEDVIQLALGNKDATLRWLDELIAELQQVRGWISEGEEEVVTALMLDLDLKRNRWLEERAKNEWVEVSSPDVEGPSFSQQMLGGLGRPRERSND